jgi:hypothetical protein
MKRLALLFALVIAAPAHAEGVGGPPSCGAPKPTKVITGSFTSDQTGSFVMLPFDVPKGTTAIRGWYCYDQPDGPTAQLPAFAVRHTIDFGYYGPRPPGQTLWTMREYRGWSGSGFFKDITVSPEGYAPNPDPGKKPVGTTSRGYRPGPIEPGTWAVELGVAAVVDQAEGDLDGRVAWRVEVELSSDPAFADEPYRAASYDRAPARSEPGWYAGDLHVHAEHSALGDATMTEAFDYAFAPPPQGAGLDFVTLTDYVSGSSWGEVGRYQGRYPGKLIVRSAEVITYRGHTNSQANTRNVDYRTGPLYERRADGSLATVREPLGPLEIFRATHAGGGFTQVNHPTIFPSEVPAFAGFCRGCPWDYSDAETGWRTRVDAYEVHTGPPGLPGPTLADPGPNPFTLTAIQEFDRLRREGNRVTAVAVSDSHNAGRSNNPVTQSPIGVGTTVVYAPELSETGVKRAVRAGHAYVKLFGPDSPDLRLEAVGEGGRRAMMGDPLPGSRASFTARVIGGVATAQPRSLVVLRGGSEIARVPVTGNDFTHEFEAGEPGDYRIQVMRGNAVDALTNPITVGAVPPAAQRAKRMRLTLRPRRVRAGRRVRFRLRVRAAGRPLRGVRVRLGGKRAVTGRRGRARITRRFARRGLRRAVARRPGYRRAVARVRVVRRR